MNEALYWEAQSLICDLHRDGFWTDRELETLDFLLQLKR